MKELLERMKTCGHSPDAQAQNIAEFASMILAYPEVVGELERLTRAEDPAGDSPADA